MKTLLPLIALTTCALSVMADESSSPEFISDEGSQTTTVTIQRDALSSEQTMLGIVHQDQYTLIDGNCLAELEGSHDTASELYVTVSDDYVKIVGDIAIEFALATPELTLECGPFVDCLPCPQNLAKYKEPYEETMDTGAVEFPDGVRPEGCGGGDGPGGRAPAMCTVTDSPCAVTCSTSSEQ